jgi:hypothetical protein
MGPSIQQPGQFLAGLRLGWDQAWPPWCAASVDARLTTGMLAGQPAESTPRLSSPFESIG